MSAHLDIVEGLSDRLRCIGRDIADDIDALSVRNLLDSPLGILIVHIDREIRAELAGEFELLASAASPVTMIRSAPASLQATTLANPRWPGPKINTVSPGPFRGISTTHRNPVPSGLNMTAISAGKFRSTL